MCRIVAALCRAYDYVQLLVEEYDRGPATEEESQILALFSASDFDEDGELSLDEIHAMLLSLNPSSSMQQATEFFIDAQGQNEGYATTRVYYLCVAAPYNYERQYKCYSSCCKRRVKGRANACYGVCHLTSHCTDLTWGCTALSLCCRDHRFIVVVVDAATVLVLVLVLVLFQVGD